MTVTPMRPVAKGYLLCFSAVVAWSFSEIVVKLLQEVKASGLGEGVGPVLLSFYRFFFGGSFILLLMVARRQVPGTMLLIKRNAFLVLVSSMVAFGLSNVIYFAGIRMTQANVGAALYVTYPIFISIYGIFILHERTNIPLKIAGSVLGFVGMALLMTDFDLSLFVQPDKILGNILLVLAAAIWGFYSVLGKKVFTRERLLPVEVSVGAVEIKYTAVSNLLACVPVLVLLPFFPEELALLFRHSLYEWLLILFMGIVITGLSLYVFFTGIKMIEVAHGISMSMFKPVMVAVFSFFILGELPSIAMYVAFPLIMVAVLLVNRRR